MCRRRGCPCAEAWHNSSGCGSSSSPVSAGGDPGEGELGHDPHSQSLAEGSFHLDVDVLCAGLLSNPSTAGDQHVLLSSQGMN